MPPGQLSSIDISRYWMIGSNPRAANPNGVTVANATNKATMTDRAIAIVMAAAFLIATPSSRSRLIGSPEHIFVSADRPAIGECPIIVGDAGGGPNSITAEERSGCAGGEIPDLACVIVDNG